MALLRSHVPKLDSLVPRLLWQALSCFWVDFFWGKTAEFDAGKQKAWHVLQSGPQVTSFLVGLSYN